MQIERQSEQYGSLHDGYVQERHQAIPPSEIADLLKGPRITPGLLHSRKLEANDGVPDWYWDDDEDEDDPLEGPEEDPSLYSKPYSLDPDDNPPF